MNRQQTVFVGLSGGVDSSVAALRLKNQGYAVVGVFIKVWQPDFLDCNWEAERLDAMRVAAFLEIPFLTCDAETAYKQGVADYFIAEYKAGRTPNPDVMCNKTVKFAAFYDFAKNHGADYIATGHYAQNILNQAKQNELHRGVDTGKDQTYFLWTLPPKKLPHILFPIGDTTKSEIRKEAVEAGLPVATKKDSQGICFLGHVDIPEFLSHFVELVPGEVLNESGEVVGTHGGALVYTLGQRHGFAISENKTAETPQYVVHKDLERNTITVSNKPVQYKAHSELHLSDVNFINAAVELGQIVEIQTRYRQSTSQAKVLQSDQDNLVLLPQEPLEVAAAGQSCVLYAGTQCLGGGIISV